MGCALTFYGFIIEKAAAQRACDRCVSCLFGAQSVRTRGVCVVRVGQSATRTRARVDARSVRDTCSMRACGPRAHKKRRSFAEPRLREARCALKGFACVVRADTRVFVLFCCIHSSHTRPWVYTWPQMHTRPQVSSEAQYSLGFIVMSYCTTGAAASPPRGRSLRPHRHPHRRSSSVFSECTETSNVPARAAGGGFHKRE